VPRAGRRAAQPVIAGTVAGVPRGRALSGGAGVDTASGAATREFSGIQAAWGSPGRRDDRVQPVPAQQNIMFNYLLHDAAAMTGNVGWQRNTRAVASWPQLSENA